MPLYLTDNEERSLLKFLTLCDSHPFCTAAEIKEKLLEVDRGELRQVLRILEQRKGKPEYLR